MTETLELSLPPTSLPAEAPTSASLKFVNENYILKYMLYLCKFWKNGLKAIRKCLPEYKPRTVDVWALGITVVISGQMHSFNQGYSAGSFDCNDNN